MARAHAEASVDRQDVLCTGGAVAFGMLVAILLDGSKPAQAVFGVKNMQAVMGGFHLAPFKEGYVREVVASLKELDPDYIVPTPCTGEPFYEIGKAEMPAKLPRSFTGARFMFV